MSTKITPATAMSAMAASPASSTGAMAAADPARVPTSSKPTTNPTISSPIVPEPSRSNRALRGHETQRGREARGLKRVDALVASGQLDKALDHLRKLVNDFPHSTRGYLRMVSLLRENQRPGEALAVLKNAIKQTPNVPATREVLAEMCLELGHWREAIQQSRALLALNPRSLLARDVLAAAYFQSGELNKALQTIAEMITLDPKDATNHFKRGVLLQQKGEIGGAIRAFSRVVEMAPDSEAASESRAALEMLDNYQIRQIVARATEDATFYLHLMHDPWKTTVEYGYPLSEFGFHALCRIPLQDLPPAPPGWRQFNRQ